MPQMSPLLWLNLYIFTLLILMILMVIIYFLNIYFSLDSFLSIKKKKNYFLKW